jgi:hypothetical protein
MLPPKLNIGPVADAFADVQMTMKAATGGAVQLMATSPIPITYTSVTQIQ